MEYPLKRDISCCFSGHRPDKLPWGEDENDLRCRHLKLQIRAALEAAYEKGKRHFICGMALGADFYFCEAVLDLREKYSGITLEAAIPCEEQADHWKEQARNRYFTLVGDCDFETMVQHHYDKSCMLRRNRYMVDRSSMLIAAYSGVLGGTMYTLSYAMKKGLEIVSLDIKESL